MKNKKYSQKLYGYSIAVKLRISIQFLLFNSLKIRIMVNQYLTEFKRN